MTCVHLFRTVCRPCQKYNLKKTNKITPEKKEKVNGR